MIKRSQTPRSQHGDECFIPPSRSRAEDSFQCLRLPTRSAQRSTSRKIPVASSHESAIARPTSVRRRSVIAEGSEGQITRSAHQLSSPTTTESTISNPQQKSNQNSPQQSRNIATSKPSTETLTARKSSLIKKEKPHSTDGSLASLLHESSSESAAPVKTTPVTETARKYLQALKSPLSSSTSDLGSLVSSQARCSANVPVVSDSYIDKNHYVTKAGWELKSVDERREQKTAEKSRTNRTKPLSRLERTPPKNEHPMKLQLDSLASRPSSAEVSHLGDDLFSVGLKKQTLSPLQMDALSMEKVFNDPSFHGLYERYRNNKRKSVTQSEVTLDQIKQTGKQVMIKSERKRMAPPDRPAASPKARPAFTIQPTQSPRKSLSGKESLYAKAVREQLPDQVAILDTEVLAILTEEMVQESLPLQKLRDVSFRKRPDGTLECLSIMDLGLEKKDHQFLTDTWQSLTKLTDECRYIYDLVYASGCYRTAFVKNIMAFMSHAIDQGLDLATVLIKTATFVVGRDGQPSDLLNNVQQVKQLTESLHSNIDFLDTVREVLTENFSAIPLVTGDAPSSDDSLRKTPRKDVFGKTKE